MGIGEPLKNYDNVVKAVRIMNRMGMGIGAPTHYHLNGWHYRRYAPIGARRESR